MSVTNVQKDPATLTRRGAAGAEDRHGGSRQHAERQAPQRRTQPDRSG